MFGRVLWGTDTSSFYRDIARLAELPAGTKVLDIPCGGGVAFRGLRPEQELDYVAADLSPVMLRRARAEADRRGIHWIEFTEADVEALPFDDRSFDLVITYTGLHCFPDPPAAIAEMARVLRPGGELRGTSVIKQAGLRQRAFVRLMQAGGVFGPGLTLAELETSLADAGLVKATTSRNGALAYFSARRRGGGVVRSGVTSSTPASLSGDPLVVVERLCGAVYEGAVMPLQEGKTAIGQTKKIWLYHRIWRAPEGLRNDDGLHDKASDFRLGSQVAKSTTTWTKMS